MFIEQINDFIQQHNLIRKGSKIILGLSGGPDSIFLLHFLAQMQQKDLISLVAAHLDHEWRADSYKDVKFCQQACQQLGVPVATAKISELCPQAKFNGSREEFARKVRRQFLESVKNSHQADAITLAHHLQDQQETFFIRLIRGTSLTGLTVMRPKYGAYIRPLLEVNKPDILNWLHENNIAYLTDPANVVQDFLRNRIRQTVIPPLKACDERFDKNFLITLNRLKATEEFLEQLTIETFARISVLHDEIHKIDLTPFFKLHPAMQQRILMHWLITTDVPFVPTQKFLNEILRFLQQKGTKTHEIHEQWKLVKIKECVHIEKY